MNTKRNSPPAKALTCWRCRKPFDKAHPFGKEDSCVCVYPAPRQGKPPESQERWLAISQHIVRGVVAEIRRRQT